MKKYPYLMLMITVFLSGSANAEGSQGRPELSVWYEGIKKDVVNRFTPEEREKFEQKLEELKRRIQEVKNRRAMDEAHTEAQQFMWIAEYKLEGPAPTPPVKHVEVVVYQEPPALPQAPKAVAVFS